MFFSTVLFPVLQSYATSCSERMTCDLNKIMFYNDKVLVRKEEKMLTSNNSPQNPFDQDMTQPSVEWRAMLFLASLLHHLPRKVNNYC